MLNPSYSKLIQILNADANADARIASRYSVVIAAAKRARQIVGGADHEVFSDSDKAVSIAVNEIKNGHIRIIPGSNGYWDIEAQMALEAQNVPSLVDENYIAADVETIVQDLGEDDGWEDEIYDEDYEDSDYEDNDDE